MAYSIRNAVETDIPRILEIYTAARTFMAASGNPNQWTGGYPDEATVRGDLAWDQLYVCADGAEILGVFCFFRDIEPDYLAIYEGSWLCDGPYGVVHRIATDSRQKGVASHCLQYAFDRCGDLRIDTHRDNLPMQNLLAKNGFSRRGIIYLCKNGDERIAYQKIQ